MPVDTTTYTWTSAAFDLATIALGWIAGRILARLALPVLRRLLRQHASEAVDLLIAMLCRALPWILAAIAAMVTIRIGPSTPELIQAVDQAAKVALTLIVTLTLAKFLSELMRRRALPVGSVGATTLTRKFLYWIIVVVGCVVVLTQIGVEITPVLAALGVGSLAVGLALQPTLTNVFAGFNLSLAQRTRIGDFVRLDGGQEGQIVDIGWRSTEIRSIGDSIVLVPNGKLAEIIVVNYSLPGEPVSLPVELTVAYGSDLDEVERVTLDEARGVQRDVPEAVPDHEPILRFQGFGDSAIRLIVVLRARTFPDRMPLIHEFVKRIKKRYEREGIEIPFPQRVVRTLPLSGTAGGEEAT